MRVALLLGALFVAVSAQASPRCKLRALPVGTPLYTNQDLETPGGVDLADDCLAVFLDVIRAGTPRPARLTYDLPQRDLFQTLDDILAASKEPKTKLEIHFSLPQSGEMDPAEMTDIRVDLFPSLAPDTAY